MLAVDDNYAAKTEVDSGGEECRADGKTHELPI